MIETSRLILRPWRESDLKPFAEMNADPEVCEFLPCRLSEAESNEFARRIMAKFEEQGFGWFALELKQDNRFIGFAGLNRPSFEAPFMPAVEIGWRLSREHWGRGYATEAGQAAMEFGFGKLGLKEIVSFTVADNLRSRAVMERLGMTHYPDEDFDHPSLPEGHRLRKHVLYRSI